MDGVSKDASSIDILLGQNYAQKFPLLRLGIWTQCSPRATDKWIIDSDYGQG